MFPQGTNEEAWIEEMQRAVVEEESFATCKMPTKEEINILLAHKKDELVAHECPTRRK